MSQQPIPPASLRSGFEHAQRTHAQGAHIQGPHTQGPHTQGPTPYNPEGASRQIAQTGAAVSVEQAIASAAQQTSVDFDYLIAQAQVESAMDPTARARTSSATGLYQFIESTWLNTMQRHGARFGLGDVAAQISTTPSGAAYVADPGTRAAILNLRNDPQIASFMAAGLAEDNRAHLTPILGRQPDHGELYLAHFLGAGGAGRFLAAMSDNPGQRADALFRRPAAANRPVFYERDGSPRTLAGVMDYLSGKLERARANAPVSMPAGLAQGLPQSPYQASSLSPPSYTPAPYIIADEGVFGPRNPPVLTGRNRPTISRDDAISLPAPATRSRQSVPGQTTMSSMLQSTFGTGTAQGEASSTQQVRRAYEQLRALGF